MQIAPLNFKGLDSICLRFLNFHSCVPLFILSYQQTWFFFGCWVLGLGFGFSFCFQLLLIAGHCFVCLHSKTESLRPWSFHSREHRGTANMFQTRTLDSPNTRPHRHTQVCMYARPQTQTCLIPSPLFQAIAPPLTQLPRPKTS